LSLRLDTVFGHIRKAREEMSPGRVVDVGSDHGQTAIRSLSSGAATYALCTDINEGPAMICRTNLASAGYSDKASVIVTDGLDGVALKEEDIIVISGLGGLNTIDILKRAFEDNEDSVVHKTALVLQPQKTIEDLRRFLREKLFKIKDETSIKDSGFHYVVLTAVWSGTYDRPDLSDMAYSYLGPVLLQKYRDGDPDAAEHYEYLQRTLGMRARSSLECKEALNLLNDIKLP